MIGLAVIGMPRKAMVESILSYWTGLTVNLTPQQLQVISSSLHAPLSLNVETHDEVTLDLLGFAFVDRVVRLGVHFSIVFSFDVAMCLGRSSADTIGIVPLGAVGHGRITASVFPSPAVSLRNLGIFPSAASKPALVLSSWYLTVMH